MTEATATQLTDEAHAAMRIALRQQEDIFGLELALSIARFWADRNQAPSAYLPSPSRQPEQQAIWQMISGQLLMSRKLVPADRFLSDGFAKAAPLLSAKDYLTVMNRHKRLECLQLKAQPSPPRRLDELLMEADVIKRLEQGTRRRRRPGKPNDGRSDTVG